MKTSVYLLEKDFVLIDSIKKRFLIETVCELKGAANDASAGYSEIQATKPDILIFGYPMNFTAMQLVQAMKSVNPNMEFIALLDDASKQIELTQAGIHNIYNKPFDVGIMMEYVRKLSTLKANPFGTPSSNPFGVQEPQNIAVNPFSGGATQVVGQNSFNSSPVGGGGSVNPYSQMNTSIPSSTSYNPMGGFTNQSPSAMPHMGTLAQNQDFTAPIGQTFKTIRQNLIAIHCPKGGVGKTSVSTNIAALLSTVKIGKQPLNVLLVDMDWQFGDVCINMGMQPVPNIMNWVNDIKARRSLNENANMNFTQAQIDKYLITYKTGLKILAAPSSHNDVLEIPEDTSKIVIDNLKNNTNFDVILFDCGNNLESHTLQTLLAAHSVYEVITMDVSAMGDLTMALNTLKSVSFPLDKIKLIVNKLPKADREFAINEISEALGLEVASVIPENEKVRVQNNKGEPLVLSKTSNSFTEGIKQTANTMLGNNLFSKKSKGSSKGDKEPGFLSKLFGRR